MKSGKRRNQTIIYIVKLLLLFVTTGIYGAIWYTFYAANLYHPFYFWGNFVVIFVFMIMYANFSILYGVFELKVSRTSDLVYSNIIALLVTSFLMYGVMILLERRLPKVLPMVLFLVVSFIICIPWAFLANRTSNRVLGIQNILLIYDNENARRNGEYIIRSIPWRYHLLDQIRADDDVRETIKAIESYGPYGVMLCGIHSSPRNTILKYCIENDIPVYIRPNIGDIIVNSAEDIQLANLPVMLCERAEERTTYLIGKRIMDIVLSLIGILVFSPFIIITAIAIKLYDHGPIFYKQVRLTKDRKEFFVYNIFEKAA